MLCSLLPAPASAEQQIVVGNALTEEDGPVTAADPAAGQEEADEPGEDTPNDTDVTPGAEGTAEPETASAEPAETEQPEAGEEADESRRSILNSFSNVFNIDQFAFPYVLDDELQELRIQVFVIWFDESFHSNSLRYDQEEVMNTIFLCEIVL